jgi:hypothetical protein
MKIIEVYNCPSPAVANRAKLPNHATFSSTRSVMLAFLFPAHADFIRGVGKEAGDSRIWAGIHYQIDLDSGNALGKSIAQKFVTWANNDGSQ